MTVTRTGPTTIPFERVVEEHGAAVLRVCRAVLGPVPGADPADAWSETFLAALRAYPDLRADSNVRGWLVTIAHNKAIDQVRRVQRAPVASGNLPELPSSDVPIDGLDPDLAAALAGLPPKQRGAVIYRYLGDLSYAAVATLLDCSESAARRNAADGIARLRSTPLSIEGLHP